MSEIAKESGHWYTKDGKPSYTRVAKNGNERPTTLRDAKKENLYPSVTTIMKVKAAPGLEIWKQNQILQSAATLPKIDGESVDDWCKRVIEDAGEHGKQAREAGTAIHGAIERYFIDGKYDDEQPYCDEVFAVGNLLAELELYYVSCEKSFSSCLGYAGKTDLLAKDKDGRYVIVDFKTTDFKGKGKKHWPEMVIQLAAYAEGLELDNYRAINIFISRNLDKPEADYYEWTQEEITSGWRQFELLLELWQIEKDYKPE